jgi:hypothetical protein
MYEEARLGSIEFIFDRFVIALGVDTKNIIFLISSLDEADFIHNYCKEKDLSVPRVFTYSFYEKLVKRKVYVDNVVDIKNDSTLEDIANKHDYESFSVKSPLQNDRISKLFLFLNKEIQDVGSIISSESYRSGVRRQHRITLLLALYAKGLLDKTYVSFPKLPARKNLAWINNIKPELQKIARQGFDVLYKLPFVLDIYQHESLKFTFDYATTKDELLPFYNNSMFSIIAETHFFTTELDKRKCRFLTEKTFRPLSLKQPFIIVSVPGTLQEIRRLGYKTFDGIIDESYDNIKDDDSRLLKIIEEIERLSNLDNNTLDDYRMRLLPIVEYNYKHLMERKDHFSEIIFRDDQ